jgi:hypothetical protein
VYERANAILRAEGFDSPFGIGSARRFDRHIVVFDRAGASIS